MAHHHVKTRKPAPPASDSQPQPRDACPAQAKTLSFPRHVALFAAGIGVGALGLFAVQALRPRPAPPASPAPSARSMPTSYYDLLAMSPDELAKVDIALMNLLCAKGLPGAENLDISGTLKKLDEWAAKVKGETERHLYRVKDPRYAEHYGNSEARLRAEFIVQCLQEDCGVRYNPQRIDTADWHNSQDLFLHGLVGSSNGGTCSSMPLVYTVIGRRLGYPMKLVLAGSHIFCRWDGEHERFNIEGASDGGVSYFDDEYYRKWPKAISEAEVQRGEFLKSLTAAEELSSFLIDRGMCLDQNGRYSEARAAFAEAHRLMPQSAFHLRQLAISMRQVLGAPGAAERRRRQDMDAWLQQFMVPEPQAGPPQIPRPGGPGAAPGAAGTPPPRAGPPGTPPDPQPGRPPGNPPAGP
jgi:hypothetical protein